MPRTGESPAQRLARASALRGTEGERYVERRAIPMAIAEAAGLRFDPDLDGRPAVLAPLVDARGELRALHGRYLHARRGEDKMLTVGAPGGLFAVLEGWRAPRLVLVEGVFDALLLAACGTACLATIGRPAASFAQGLAGDWLAELAAGRRLWLAFDAGRAGDAYARAWEHAIGTERVRRLPPPTRCKDWSTALGKLGHARVSSWLGERLGPGGTTSP